MVAGTQYPRRDLRKEICTLDWYYLKFGTAVLRGVK
jgi:hypothetical protein